MEKNLKKNNTYTLCICSVIYMCVYIHIYIYTRVYTYTCVCVCSVASHVHLFATPWTVACQAPLSMGFARQEYWSGLSCPPPGHLPHPGTELESPMSPALTGGFFTTESPGKPPPPPTHMYINNNWITLLYTRN